MLGIRSLSDKAIAKAG